MSVGRAPAQRVAPPRAECVIDLAALRANVRTLAAGLANGAELWAVVKANAYGHDVDRVAQEVIAAGARRLCVATLSEARQLRNAGVRVPILIMGPLDTAGVARAHRSRRGGHRAQRPDGRRSHRRRRRAPGNHRPCAPES